MDTVLPLALKNGIDCVDRASRDLARTHTGNSMPWIQLRARQQLKSQPRPDIGLSGAKTFFAQYRITAPLKVCYRAEDLLSTAASFGPQSQRYPQQTSGVSPSGRRATADGCGTLQ